MSTTPEDRTYQESSLCSLGPQPQVMTAAFVALFRDHFASADNIEHAVFRERLYTGSTAEDSTGILIEDASVWTPTRTARRPAIIIKRNGWQHTKRLAGANTGKISEDYTEHVTYMQGSHTVFCMSPNGGETEVLAAEVYRHLMRYSEIFRKYFTLQRFVLGDIGPLSILQETTIHFAVPISVAYGWQERWLLKKHAATITDTRLAAIFEQYYGS